MARNELNFALSTCYDNIFVNQEAILPMNEEILWEPRNTECCVLFARRMEANSLWVGGLVTENSPFLRHDTSLGARLSLSSPVPFQLKSGNTANIPSLIRLPPINQRFKSYD